jgi:hypothetical protein
MRYAGDKTFLCTRTQCTDTTYVPDQMHAEDLVFMSERYWTLLDAHPTWARYFALADEVIFVAETGTAYRFRLGAADKAVARPAATIAPTLQPSTATPAIERPPTTPNRPRASEWCTPPLLLPLLVVALATARQRHARR